MKVKIIAVITMIGALSGCSTVQEGLIGDTRANIEPFAKETINALVVETMDFRASELVYLRYYVEQDPAEITRLRSLLVDVSAFRRQLIIYSLELVRVTDMNSTEEAQIAALADAISGQMRDDYINFLHQSAADFDAKIANIRAQEEFLDAVKAVEPILKIAADYHASLLNEIEDEALPAARELIDARIAEEFGVFLEHIEYMAKRKDQILIGMRLAREARQGKTESLQALRDSGIILSESAMPPANAGEKDFDRVEKYLLKELETLGEVEKLLAQDRADYLATRSELEQEVSELSAGIRFSRLQVSAWMQAHEALANGVKDPGKWLSAALGVAGSARHVL